MKQNELKALARATCCWLTYKDILGFDEMLGESMLALPISEFLVTQTNWKVESEVQYKNLKGPSAPDIWCDFVGTPTFGKEAGFILEAKYLKGSAKNAASNIAADLIRLSLPNTEKPLKRFFLLAGRGEHFPKSDGDLLLGHNLFGLTKGQGRYIKPREEIAKPDFLKRFPKFESLLALQENYLLDFAYVQHGADVTIESGESISMRVMIWSVGRSKVMAKEGAPVEVLPPQEAR